MNVLATAVTQPLPQQLSLSQPQQPQLILVKTMQYLRVVMFVILVSSASIRAFSVGQATKHGVVAKKIAIQIPPPLPPVAIWTAQQSSIRKF
jgi:hypothetical protein